MVFPGFFQLGFRLSHSSDFRNSEIQQYFVKKNEVFVLLIFVFEIFLAKDDSLFAARGVCDPAILSDGHKYYISILDTLSTECIFCDIFG